MPTTSIAARSRRAAAVAATGLAVLAAAPVAAGSAQTPGLTPMKADVLRQMLQTGKSDRRLDNIDVAERLDLQNVEVTHPFECTNCVFEKGINAHDAVFARRVDLSGATFHGNVDMTGATFAAPALFQASPPDGGFLGDADFTLATFGDLADFENAEFKGAATFELTRFRGDTIFAGNQDSAFDGATTFDRASFGAKADFRQRTFTTVPVFLRATFSGPADFGQSAFPMGTQFEQTHFGAEAAFSFASFGTKCTRVGEPKKPPCVIAAFDGIRSPATIDFTAANIFGTLRVANSDLGGLTFANAVFVESGCESGHDTCVATTGQLQIDHVRTPDFFMDIGNLDNVVAADPSATDHTRREVLGLLESSAKANNDLALANDAHFRLQSLQSNDYWAPIHWLDVFFYQWIAGYLVRPDHPLLTLLALALLVSLLRTLVLVPEPQAVTAVSRVRPSWQRRLKAAGATTSRLARRVGTWFSSRLWPALCHFGHELLDTFRLVWPGTAAAAQGRRFEAFAYRVLFVCMLIGFANSNPTLRQILDAVL